MVNKWCHQLVCDLLQTLARYQQCWEDSSERSVLAHGLIVGLVNLAGCSVSWRPYR